MVDEVLVWKISRWMLVVRKDNLHIALTSRPVEPYVSSLHPAIRLTLIIVRHDHTMLLDRHQFLIISAANLNLGEKKRAHALSRTNSVRT